MDNKVKFAALGVATVVAVGAISVGGPITFFQEPEICPIEVPSNKSFTSVKFKQLTDVGYTGCNSLESIMRPLAEYYYMNGTKYVDGKVWWMDMKDKAPKSKAFKDVIFDDLKAKYTNHEIQ